MAAMANASMMDASDAPGAAVVLNAGQLSANAAAMADDAGASGGGGGGGAAGAGAAVQHPAQASSRILGYGQGISQGGDMDGPIHATGAYANAAAQQHQAPEYKPQFAALSARQMAGGKDSTRRVRVPSHRYTPLRQQWENIITPLVKHLMLQVRMNLKKRCVELKTSKHTVSASALQKGADFVQAFMMGFEVQDAVALLRLDDLFIDSFQVTDVKMLKGDHLGRAVGRVAGQNGKTKYAIENATRTRIVVADRRIHILGSHANIRTARNAICALIMGAPPGKVYNRMRGVARKMNQQHSM
jgi:RNA-binding protein PNO1